jgi:hypothetical protein
VTRRAAVYAAAAAVIVVAAASGVWAELASGAFPDPGLPAVAAASAIGYGLVGLLIVYHRPANPIGRLCLAAGTVAAAGLASRAVALIDARSGDGLGPGGALAIWISGIAPTVALLMAGPILLVLFPDGRPSRRAWWAVPALAVVVAVLVAILALRPEYVQIGAWIAWKPIRLDGLDTPAWDSLWIPTVAIVVLLVGLSIGAFVDRFVHADRTTRLQLRWLGAAISLAVVAIPVALVAGDAGFSVAAALTGMGVVALPVAVGTAVLRYRLYEIDRIVSRTIGYAVVTGVLVAVFAASIVVLGGLLAEVAGGDTLAVAASTLLAAGLFQPVRSRVQRAVDRRFHRAHYDLDREARTLETALRDEIDVGAVLDQVRGALLRTLEPGQVGVWLRQDGDDPRHDAGVGATRR